VPDIAGSEAVQPSFDRRLPVIHLDPQAPYLQKLKRNSDRRLLAGSCLMLRELRLLGSYVLKVA